jgi:hypothetical protein
MNHRNPSLVRRCARAVALTPALLVPLAAGAAVAAPPEQWDQPEPVSSLTVLWLLVAIPIGLFAVIALLTYLPSMVRGERYTPGLAWRNENEWFGGPKSGVEAADNVQPEALEGVDTADRGGASARW